MKDENKNKKIKQVSGAFDINVFAALLIDIFRAFDMTFKMKCNLEKSDR